MYLAILLSLISCASLIARDQFISNSRFIVDPVNYQFPQEPISYHQHVITGSEPLVIHILEVNPKITDIRICPAQGFEREMVSSIAQHTGAMAAINGGFFRRGGQFNGNSLLPLIIDGKWHADPFFTCGAIGWDKNGNYYCDIINTSHELFVESPRENHFCHIVFRLNQPMHDEEPTLYTPTFFKYTGTKKHTHEFIIRDNILTDISPIGNQLIPEDGMIFAINNRHIANVECEKGSRIRLQSTIFGESSDSEWKNINYLIGGFLLVKDGICRDAEQMMNEHEPNYQNIAKTGDEIIADFLPACKKGLIYEKHPRSAVGIKKDGTVVLVVVEGRQPGRSIGVTLPELADIMRDLGCMNALNLGGGGDSAMVLNGTLMSNTSGSTTPGYVGNDERPVANAICVFAKDR